MKDGEDHCPNFKASVVVNRKTFDTPAVCNKSKQALNEAAKVAFLNFNSGIKYMVLISSTEISSKDQSNNVITFFPVSLYG